MQIKDIAMMLGLTDQTVYNWLDRLGDFFSADALGKNGTREFDLNDQQILITIWDERERKTGFEDIEALLRTGYRSQRIPPGVANVEGVTPLALYTQSMAVVTERNLLQRQLDQSREEIMRLREQIEIMHREWREDKAESNADLYKEIGKLQARIEMMMEQQGKS